MMETTTMDQDQTTYQTTVKPLSLKTQRKFRKLLNLFHLGEGVPIGDILTYTQLLIIVIISKRLYKRVQLILPTQYGKSLSVAIGVLLRVTTHKEKWAIVAPTEDKARIIMDYIIEHVYDDPMLLALLDYNGTKEQLLKERSKTRITFRGQGEVRVYTADSTNMKALEKALTGFGAPNVIIDESAIIPDKVYAMIKRMVGGTKDNFLLEIGNPFLRNHFWRTWNGERYWKIFVDVYQALKEGRYTEDYVAEMEEEALFDVLYKCHFPDEGELLPKGYRQLLSYNYIENSFIKQDLPLGYDEAGHLIDNAILGIDPNHGGLNSTAFVIRFPKTGFAKLLLKKRYADSRDVTGQIVADARKYIHQYEIKDYRVGVDAGGVGAGVADQLSREFYIQAILFGQSADDKERYANKKAEMYFELRKWIRSGNGKLVKHDGFLELKDINYKETSTSKLQMESKEDLALRAIQSPDVADALALTFVSVSDIADDDDVDII